MLHKNIQIRLARSAKEIEAAQRLRYQVFYEEHNAKPSPLVEKLKRDVDDYDDYADHLVVIDESASNNSENIVGTYRLLKREGADRYGQFYTSDEYDITPLLRSDLSLLELGRSCVLPEYRTRPVMQLLWEGIADYIMQNDIELLFGCASLQSTDVKSIAHPLSYLYHFHLARKDMCPRAVKGRYINMNIVPKDEIDPRKAFANLPPLIKGYIRVGAMIGDGAVVDEQFNTTDVCIIVETSRMTARYRKHYERKLQKQMPGHMSADEILL